MIIGGQGGPWAVLSILVKRRTYEKANIEKNWGHCS